MKNIDVIKTFVNGGTKAKTTNLYIDGDKLMNYTTCLCERFEKLGGQEFGFVINTTKYSQSTTTIQNKLYDYIPEDLITAELRNIPMGAYSLITD